MLRGKCYDCGGKISPQYPLIEAAMAALFVAAGVATPWL
jgi:prepilin signal peptidase PulO-like enzyme (type II secretory pathway)